MASRKPINEQQLLRERLRSVSIDLESDVEYLERRCSRLLWDLQELSKVLGQVEGCLGADAERAPATPITSSLVEKLSSRSKRLSTISTADWFPLCL